MERHKHICFNHALEGIESVINRLGGNTIWSLSHIVPISEFASVAVFSAWDGNADEEVEFGRKPVLSAKDTLNQAGNSTTNPQN